MDEQLPTFAKVFVLGVGGGSIRNMASTSESNRKRTKSVQTPELRVVFDTNILITKSPQELVRARVAELVATKYNGLNVVWYVPDVVRHERQYQMQARALELLPTLVKLEALLGHRLGITEDVVLRRVEEAIRQQFLALGLQELPLDRSAVDWERLTLDAAYRRPPFDIGEKEKGFRDALVAESYLQLVDRSPKTARTCRVVLVTEDQRLRTAVESRIKEYPNARVVPNVDELISLINTLSEEVTEEFIEKYRSKAQAMFFSADIVGSLVYKEKLVEELGDKFAHLLKQVPPGADQRTNGKWHVDAPSTFVRKGGQRVTWRNRIVLESEALRLLVENDSVKFFGGTGEPFTFRRTREVLVADSWEQLQLESEKVWKRPPARKRYRRVARGREIFEVLWSVTISTKGVLSAPRVEETSHVETVWEDDHSA